MKAALIRLHVAVFIWGFTGVLGRLISLNEGWLVWWRMCITAVSLWALLLMQGKLYRISLRDFFKMTGIGTLLAVHWMLFYGSIKYANVSIALVCFSTTGLIAAISEPLFFGKPVKAIEIFLGLLTLGGIAIIYAGNMQFSAGIILGLSSAAMLVLVSLFNKKFVARLQPMQITLYQLSGGFIGLSLLMPLYDLLVHSSFTMPAGAEDWLWLAILSWFCTILAIILSMNALKKVSAFTLNLTLTLEPIYGIILAFAIFHENESLSWYFYPGIMLIIVAVILQTRILIKQNKKAITDILVQSAE